MMEEARAMILRLLAAHRVMRLATIRPDGWAQTTTVGYVSEGLNLYFLCGPGSQKAANLARDNRVSLTIDHDTPDVMAIQGLSMGARAIPVTEPAEVLRILQLLISRYPPQPMPGPMPSADSVRVFRIVPEVISVLDYSKGFGHAELIFC